jgi:hypothetical protein
MSKDSGYLVETKTGKKGRTYHREGLVNGKMIVHIDGEDKPLLCDPQTVKIIGFAD